MNHYRMRPASEDTKVNIKEQVLFCHLPPPIRTHWTEVKRQHHLELMWCVGFPSNLTWHHFQWNILIQTRNISPNAMVKYSSTSSPFRCSQKPPGASVSPCTMSQPASNDKVRDRRIPDSHSSEKPPIWAVSIHPWSIIAILKACLICIGNRAKDSKAKVQMRCDKQRTKCPFWHSWPKADALTELQDWQDW